MRTLVPAALLALGLPALASTAVQMDVPALTRAATDVVRGRVVSSTPAWTGDHRRIVTRVTVQVVESWKGTAAGTLTVVQPGGEIDGIGQRVDGVAPLAGGDEVVLFLERSGPNHRVVGLAQGVYRVSTDGATPRAVPAALEGLHLAAPAGPAPAARVAMTIPELRDAVRATR
jgi:hypothetical protein